MHLQSYCNSASVEYVARMEGWRTMIYDAIVIGGSYAGLSAATYVARARRSVLIVDDGRPRNRFSDHAHGVLTQDGRSGREILEAARSQVAAYPTVAFRSASAVAARAEGDGFTVELADGASVEAYGLVLASGVVDVLPELPGLAERWGRSVLHCPYCHGYEVAGKHLGVLASGPMSVHQASLIADWGDVTLFTDGKVELDAAAWSLLRRRSVEVEPVPVKQLEGTAQALSGVRLEDGRMVAIAALFVGAPVRVASVLASQLGCAFEETPIGSLVRTDGWKQTSVVGVYAAGDMARMVHSITMASADGVLAGVGVHQSLIARAVRGTA
jgi:thioredoxin reductase